jgi:nucleoside phosphorylase
MSHHLPPADRDDFKIAIICALRLEYDAVTALFDEFWDSEGDTYGRVSGDQNTYTTGRIGRHNVVLALLSDMGKASAASVAANFRSSYNWIELALLVGVCGGVPTRSPEEEILLGDVIISQQVIQYDFGRRFPDNTFRKRDNRLDNWGLTADISNFLSTMQTRRHLELLHSQSLENLRFLQQAHPGEFDYPGLEEDKLFAPTYRHKHQQFAGCEICNQCVGTSDAVCDLAVISLCSDLHCDETQLLLRTRLECKKETLRRRQDDTIQGPLIHFGLIASGDTIMKSGEDRDKIAQAYKVIAFEMEGAGVWGNLPSVIIKGVCDYADSHKNKTWQKFAAAAAASVMKALLSRYTRTEKRKAIW